MSENRNILGIEIGGTKIQLLLQNQTGENLKREHFKVNVAEGAKGILSLLEKSIYSILGSDQIDAIGIGFGGPIDRDSGIIRQSSHINGWSGFSLVEWVENIVKCPVVVDNDANVAALGEALKGSGKAFELVFYVTIGSGIGGGLVRNGFIVHGRKPGECEIGLMNIDFEGNKVQDIASGWGIDERIRKGMINHPNSILTQHSKRSPGNEARHLGKALLEKDHFAQEIFDDTVRHLAWALSHVIHLIHPNVLILGGGVSKLGEFLRNSVELILPSFVTPAFQPLPPVLLSGLGEEVVPIGAIELAKQYIK